jgi:hypothetical protein
LDIAFYSSTSLISTGSQLKNYIQQKLLKNSINLIFLINIGMNKQANSHNFFKV